MIPKKADSSNIFGYPSWWSPYERFAYEAFDAEAPPDLPAINYNDADFETLSNRVQLGDKDAYDQLKYLYAKKHKYLDNLSPAELLISAAGAVAGGATGYFLDKIIHKKKNKARQLAYILGGASLGGVGTYAGMGLITYGAGGSLRDKLRIQNAANTDPNLAKLDRDVNKHFEQLAENAKRGPVQEVLYNSGPGRIFTAMWTGALEGAGYGGLTWTGAYVTPKILKWDTASDKNPLVMPIKTNGTPYAEGESLLDGTKVRAPMTLQQARVYYRGVQFQVVPESQSPVRPTYKYTPQKGPTPQITVSGSQTPGGTGVFGNQTPGQIYNPRIRDSFYRRIWKLKNDRIAPTKLTFWGPLILTSVLRGASRAYSDYIYRNSTSGIDLERLR